MSFRSVFLLPILIALAAPAAAQSDRPGDPPSKARKDAGAKKDFKDSGAKNNTGVKKESILDAPMAFYLAKGEADECGRGCSEWIAAEGTFDAGATQRLRSLLNRQGKRKLLIFFHSPGGLGDTARAMGRLLRERGMTAGVSQTIPTACAAPDDQACEALKRSGQTLAAELRAWSVCASACVYALIGATVRDVTPGARVGVHSGKLVLVHADGREPSAPNGELSPAQKARSKEFDVQFRRYVREMGVDSALSDLIATIPHEKIHFLSRDQIAGFGIDAREFSESRWATMERSKELSVVKFFVEARGAGREQYRASMIELKCGGLQRVRLVYMRGLASDEMAATKLINLVVDDRHTVLSRPGRPSRIDAIDTGGSFSPSFTSQPFAFFEAAAARDTIDIAETDSTGSGARTTKLSTAGLSQMLAKLRARCAAPL